MSERYDVLVTPHLPPYVFWKRAFDLITTLLLLPILLVLVCIISLAVFFDSGRPILFWQERVGKAGRPFKMVKFRSMQSSAERQGATFAARNDSRVTPIGRFLRRSRLDELPQFYNVLRGEMSIIGPRPEQKCFAEMFAREIYLYELRHLTRPGITGWAQVTHGYAVSIDETQEKLHCDLYYIANISLRLDIVILLRTIPTILSGFGAR